MKIISDADTDQPPHTDLALLQLDYLAKYNALRHVGGHLRFDNLEIILIYLLIGLFG